MIYRVVISHHQQKFIRQFDTTSTPTVFVFDDPNDSGIQECKLLGIDYVVSECEGNRSVNRNRGLSYIMSKFRLLDSDIVEFFDGDRFPVRYSQGFVSQSEFDVLLYVCEDDARLKRLDVPAETTRVDTGRICNPFYSCGFAIKMSAIQRIMNFNGGYLFEPGFTRWGCEDQYLGVECANLGVDVAITREITINGRVGGDSGLHDDYLESLQQYVNLIRANKFAIR